MKKIDIVGNQIGKLIVTNETKQNFKSKLYKCICECGNVRYYTKQNLLKGTLKSCGCYKKTTNGQSHKNWKGYRELSGTFFNRIKNLAKRRDINFNTNIEYLGDLFYQQKGKCTLSGITITMPKTWKSIRSFDYTSSLDRIDSSKGYLEGNVQWVHKDINMMKQQLSQTRFEELCALVTNRKNYD